MDNHETKMLRQEIENLKAQVADLKAGQDKDFEEINKLIKEVYTAAYQHIANLHDIVRPIEDHVFPRARETRKQMKSVIGPSDIFASKKWDKKED